MELGVKTMKDQYQYAIFKLIPRTKIFKSAIYIILFYDAGVEHFLCIKSDHYFFFYNESLFTTTISKNTGQES